MWDKAAEAFKFAIGDVVIHKTAEHHGAEAIRFVVLERSLGECHGGIQRHYTLRAFIQEGPYSQREAPARRFTEIFNETELVAAPPPESGIDRAERSLRDLGERVKDIHPTA